MKRLLVLIIAITSACVQPAPEDTQPGACVDSGDKEIGLLWRECEKIVDDTCFYKYLDGYFEVSVYQTMTRSECLKISSEIY